MQRELKYLKFFESQDQALSEEALKSEIASAIQRAELIANDPKKLGSILGCIKIKPNLKEAALISTRALVFSILMGLGGYLTVQTGGFTYPFLSAIAGYGAGLDLEKLEKLNWEKIVGEVKSCENCLRNYL